MQELVPRLSRILSLRPRASPRSALLQITIECTTPRARLLGDEIGSIQREVRGAVEYGGAHPSREQSQIRGTKVAPVGLAEIGELVGTEELPDAIHVARCVVRTEKAQIRIVGTAPRERRDTFLIVLCRGTRRGRSEVGDLPKIRPALQMRRTASAPGVHADQVEARETRIPRERGGVHRSLLARPALVDEQRTNRVSSSTAMARHEQRQRASARVGVVD